MNVLNIKATFKLTVDHIVLKFIQLFDSTNKFWPSKDGGLRDLDRNYEFLNYY